MKSVFAFCPNCSGTRIVRKDLKEHLCTDCGWIFFHNVAAACGVILRIDDSVLCIRRAKSPKRHGLDLPGGFVDPDETAEQALARECREELGIEPCNVKYFGSFPNRYVYRSVEYRTLDMFFLGTHHKVPDTFDRSEVEDVLLLRPADIEADGFAFESARKAMREYLSMLKTEG